MFETWKLVLQITSCKNIDKAVYVDVISSIYKNKTSKKTLKRPWPFYILPTKCFIYLGKVNGLNK